MNLAFLQDFGPIGILLVGAVVCAALDLRSLDGRGRRPQRTRWVALAALVLAFAASVGFWHSSFGATPPDIEHGSLVIDRFALYFYAIALAAAGAVVLCGADAESELDPHRGVFHLLLLVSCAGVLFTASATDLVSLGVGLALAVLPMALAQGLHKTDADSVRTATRALSVCGFSLVVFFAGAGILAGLAGSTTLHAVPAGLTHVDPLLLVGAILLILGAAAQLGIFPFLWWRAGIGVRLPILPFLAATLMGTLAGSAALLRVLPGALGAAPSSWTMAVVVLAAVTLVVAPCLAWRQRRLSLAVGYLLIGQLALVPATLPEISQQGTATVLYLLLCVIPLAAGLLGLLGSIAAQGGDGHVRPARAVGPFAGDDRWTCATSGRTGGTTSSCGILRTADDSRRRPPGRPRMARLARALVGGPQRPGRLPLAAHHLRCPGGWPRFRSARADRGYWHRPLHRCGDGIRPSGGATLRDCRERRPGASDRTVGQPAKIVPVGLVAGSAVAQDRAGLHCAVWVADD